MRFEAKKDMTECKMCGKCCFMEIPLTLLDIHRVAGFRGENNRETFSTVAQNAVSPLSSLLMIRKNDAGACIFLSKEKGCTIHSAKPNICRFYNCSLGRERCVMSWTATCGNSSQRAGLWEQSVAAKVTKAYLKKNGPVWNETDYTAALEGIFENILVRDTQKLKLARSTAGNPLAMIYDCSRCEKRGHHALETPITLDDIRRICFHLGIIAKEFFSTYIASELSRATGCLKLKRKGCCIFFDPEKHCGIRTVKPMHCRFTPCPKRTSTPEMMDALYLGSGTVEEQFRHQVAMALTREYTREWGTVYSHGSYLHTLGKIDSLAGAGFELKTFCKQIARYRYVDDTQPVIEA